MNEHGAECGQCKHFVHARLPSGRISRKRYGECTFVVHWPIAIPMNYNFRPPVAQKVWHNSNAEGCQCYAAKSSPK